MSDKNFDQHLKSVLENLEPGYDPSTWAALEYRMNAVFTEEQPAPVDSVDKALFHTLNRMEAPYQSGHWALLSERLDSLRVRLRHLRLAKLSEFVLVLLLLWNIPAFFGDTGSKAPKPGIPWRQQDVPVAQAGSGASPGHLLTGNGVEKNNPETSKAYATALQQLLLHPQAPDILGSDYLRAASVSAILGDLEALSQKAQQQIFAASNPLPADVLAALQIPERNFLMPIIPVQKSKSPGPFYLAVSGLFDQNRVLVNEKRRTSSGYGAVLALGVRKGKWGLETGVGYSNKTYAPKREVEIYAGNLADGYVGSVLTKVQTEMLTLPVKVSRRLVRVGNTSAHAVAGVTANFAAQKTFDYGTVYYAPDALPPSFLPDPDQSPKLRKSGQGILEKGRLGDNFYASVDVGVRVEHPFAKGRYTAFVEPMLRQSLSSNGVGPKREPINTLSIQAGVMAFL